jgi:hypothetical protein
MISDSNLFTIASHLSHFFPPGFRPTGRSMVADSAGVGSCRLRPTGTGFIQGGLNIS